MRGLPFRTITAGALREAIAHLDDDEPVAFSSDYGDYCHTEQVHALRGSVKEVYIEESGYSRSGWAVVREENEDPDVHDGPRVTLIE